MINAMEGKREARTIVKCLLFLWGVEGTVVEGTVVKGTMVKGTLVEGTLVKGMVVKGTLVKGMGIEDEGRGVVVGKADAVLEPDAASKMDTEELEVEQSDFTSTKNVCSQLKGFSCRLTNFMCGRW